MLNAAVSHTHAYIRYQESKMMGDNVILLRGMHALSIIPALPIIIKPKTLLKTSRLFGSEPQIQIFKF